MADCCVFIKDWKLIYSEQWIVYFKKGNAWRIGGWGGSWHKLYSMHLPVKLTCKIRKSHIAKNRNWPWSVSKVSKYIFISFRRGVVVHHNGLLRHHFHWCDCTKSEACPVMYTFVSDSDFWTFRMCGIFFSMNGCSGTFYVFPVSITSPGTYHQNKYQR